MGGNLSLGADSLACCVYRHDHDADAAEGPSCLRPICAREAKDVSLGSEQTFAQKYRLGSALGSGAFSTVYLAHCLDDNNGEQQWVAVKVTDLRSGLVSATSVSRKRHEAAMREVTAMQTVGSQAYVVGFIDAYVENSLSYIVLERCDNTLLEVLEYVDVDEDIYRTIFFEMLSGLSAVHSAGVVHRDVKPDNFLCTGRDATVKLCDFGFAGVLTRSDGRKPACHGVYGTPPFMAPEMLQGRSCGAAVDVWSFGVCAYAFLLGHFPYQGRERSSAAMKEAILTGTPPNFRPVAAKGGSGGPAAEVSEAALAFLRPALCRCSEGRPAAEELMQHPFLAAGQGHKESLPSLKPMLQAAKRVGLFGAQGAADGPDRVPMHIDEAALRGKRLGACALQVAGQVQRQTTMTEDGSTEAGSPAGGSATNSELGDGEAEEQEELGLGGSEAGPAPAAP